MTVPWRGGKLFPSQTSRVESACVHNPGVDSPIGQSTAPQTPQRPVGQTWLGLEVTRPVRLQMMQRFMAAGMLKVVAAMG